MSLLQLITLGLKHPLELRSLIHYKVWRDPLNDIKSSPESGWDRESMRECWGFLDLTSRSFAAVIKELKGELGRVICLFYLALRALDTIEDDMTIPQDKKVPLLREFYKKLEEPGWTFTESGPNEKDRALLVDFDKVIEEFQRLDPSYRTVISDITAKMGAGMASYILASSNNSLTVQTWGDYDLYCHFVAGLVGEGLSRLFSSSGIERDWLGDQLSLSNHMGLFLQKTNIIRDYAEDCVDGRHFWPAACYKARGFEAQPDVARGIIAKGGNHFRPEGEDGERAMAVLSDMLLDAMMHATRALDYLALLRDQSIFNFCAIPQVMAIATIDTMFANPDVFRRNVKIRKSQAVQLILRAVNPRDAAYVFLEFTRSIRAKLLPSDPNFVKWSVELARIEMWCETYYPSFVSASVEGREPDSRAASLKQYGEEQTQLARSRAKALGKPIIAQGEALDDPRYAGLSQSERILQEAKDRKDTMRFFTIVLGGMTFFMLIVALGGWYTAWYLTQTETDPFSLFIVKHYHTLRMFAYEKISQVAGVAKDGTESLTQKLEL